jgi:diadenylate cyclase
MSPWMIWLLELLLLAAAIDVFLRIVRQTRGNRVVRGFLVALTLGAVGLFGLVDTLELEELGHILESATGYVVVVIAILFQQELRRAISQLGSNPFLGGDGARVTPGVLEDLASAARAMAKRRHGALIAISGESPLQAIVEKATRLDAPVSRSLVESIFQPGGVLHDGGVVISDDRVVAAQCIFPLSEGTGLGAWSGTRHRAALGLSEESDAVVLAVSEETGRISLFQGGERRGPIAPDELLEALREAVGPRRRRSAAGETGARRRPAARLWSELGWLALSAGLASGLLWVAHGQISISRTQTLNLRLVDPSRAAAPRDGEVVLRAPSGEWALREDQRRVGVMLTGTRRQLDRIEALSGEADLEPGPDGRATLDAGSIRWSAAEPGLAIQWGAGRAPELDLQPVIERTFALTPDNLPIDLAAVDPRFKWDRASTTIVPDELVVSGPRELLEGLGPDGPLSLLRPAALRSSARGRTALRLPLQPQLAAAGVTLPFTDVVEVELELTPSANDLGLVEREISLACLDPARASELARWGIELHARTARLRVITEGLLPANGSGAESTRAARLRRFVEQELVVYVDVAELPADGSGRSLPVRWLLRRDWRESLVELGLDGVTLSGQERLDLVVESDEKVFLVPVDGGVEGAKESAEN